MNTWLTPMCQWATADDGPALGLICAVLAALLLAGIVLGFWPLRAWLGLGAARGRSIRADEGLLAVWRLSRQLGHTDRAAARFSVPDVPAVIVPDAMGAEARAGQLTPAPGSPVLEGASSGMRTVRRTRMGEPTRTT
jgi:hypothetical protein